MKQLILLVEDDISTRAVLRKIFEKENFAVAEASTGQDGIRLTRQLLPSLVILDLQLPDITGLDVCAALKADRRSCHTPIIVLTGNPEAGLNVMCLDQGADDFMTKPADQAELLARTRAVLRRVRFAGDRQELIRREGFSVDVARGVAILDDQTVIDAFTPKEFDILMFLVEKAPSLVSRDELTRRLWASDSAMVHQRTVDVHVRRIRLKLGTPTADRLVAVAGKGYKFV